jgi:hypothetical protein
MLGFNPIGYGGDTANVNIIYPSIVTLVRLKLDGSSVYYLKKILNLHSFKLYVG